MIHLGQSEACMCARSVEVSQTRAERLQRSQTSARVMDLKLMTMYLDQPSRDARGTKRRACAVWGRSCGHHRQLPVQLHTIVRKNERNFFNLCKPESCKVAGNSWIAARNDR